MITNKTITKFYLTLLFIIGLQYVSAQEKGRWIDMLSYLDIKAVVPAENFLLAGTQNAVFVYHPSDGTYDKYSTVQGLSGENVTTVAYHPQSGKIFAAHQDGKIEIIVPGEKVINDNSLFLSAVRDENKIIHAAFPYENHLFLGMHFGISVYDINQVHFGDSYYIGQGGSELTVNDLVIYQGKIYAATQGEGVKSIALDDPAKADYSRWQQTGNGNWKRLAIFNEKLYGLHDNRIYELAPQFRLVSDPAVTVIDISTNDEYFFVASADRVLQYNAAFTLQRQWQQTASYPFLVNVLASDNENLYIGTRKFGILKGDLQNPGRYQSLHPGCPLMNIPFAADIYDGQIYVVYGDYDQLYNPYPLDRRGISRYDGKHWINIPYDDFKKVSLTDVKINPADTSQVFIGSFHQGLLEFRSGVLHQVYDDQNSTIEPIMLGNPPSPYRSFRISPLLFDRDGNLWMFQGLVMNGIHRFNLSGGSWQAYSFADVTGTADNEGAADMHFDQEGNLWIATHRLGVVGLNPQTGEMIALTERNNIPYEGSYRNTQAAAVDKDNVLWIGTLKGLRILRQPGRAFTDPEIQTEPVIIELAELHGQDNQGEELLSNQEITEIVVDGSNRKWIGTANAGVFYFSEDGKETVYHFTTENSPLPGNAIYDIAIDPVRGTVLFSTNRGLIGFKGDATEGKNSLDDAYVYPNPVNMKRHDHLVIRNLMSEISLKITDVEGNLVWETESKGGTVIWNLKNFSGRPVASGVYLILLTDREKQNTKVLKALVIR